MDADSQTSSHASAGALGWAAEKARWRDTVLRCPGLGDHRVVLARDSVACLACALELYVFLHLMIRDDESGRDAPKAEPSPGAELRRRAIAMGMRASPFAKRKRAP